MKVFISWSGDRSKLVARAWAKFLPDILQNVQVFFSEEDIDAGEVWGNRLDTELADTHHGILCLTHENKTAPWVLYEGGCLSKHVGKARVYCYLHELGISDVGYPLARFNLILGDKAGALKIVSSVNTALEKQGVSPERLRRTFEKFYPDFESELSNVPKTETPPPDRSEKDLLQEVLTLVRGQSQRHGPPIVIESFAEPLESFTEPTSGNALPDIRYRIKRSRTASSLLSALQRLSRYAIFVDVALPQLQLITDKVQSNPTDTEILKQAQLNALEVIDHIARVAPRPDLE